MSRANGAHADKTQAIQRVDPETLSVANRAEIDAQVATARAFPRDIRTCLDEVRQLATMTEETAEAMHYAIPRGGKTIEGPSTRFAETLAYSWGNLRVESSVVGIEAREVVAESICFDLEKNVAIKIGARRRITNKGGRRFDDDMIGVTGQAAVSIAYRNAVLKAIPRSFWWPIYEEARRKAIGEGSLESRRDKALGWFRKAGKMPDEVCALLGVDREEDIDDEALVQLKGFATAIREGTTTIDRLFSGDVEDETSEGADELNRATGGD